MDFPSMQRTGSMSGDGSDKEPASDYGIMTTNEEASRCKLDAIKLGYWNDSFLQHIVHQSMSHQRKAPDILKGYFVRVKCIERLVHEFIGAVKAQGGKQVQIVNLGAGYDTLYWRLHANRELWDSIKIRVLDLDLLPVTTKKCHAIKARSVLKDALKGAIRDGEVQHGELHSDNYDLVSADIRDTDAISKKLLHSSQLDPSVPTLFVTECVLIYMESEACQRLLNWIASTFSVVGFVNYEQVKMDDKFGQIMYDSLKEQGTILADVDACKTLKIHEDRFRTAGFTAAEAADMNTMSSTLPQTELDRIDRIGMIDEPAILQQLLDHYCIVWAYKNSHEMDLSAVSLV